MKSLAIFGTVSLLACVAITFYMFGKQAEVVTDHMGKSHKLAERQGEVIRTKGGSSNKMGALPKPAGMEFVLRDIHTALLSYSLSKGDLPEAPSSTSSSNDILRQLFEAGYCQNEKPFYFPGSLISFKRPDGVTQGNNALAAGENHWAYIKGTKNQSSYGIVPVLIEPYRKGENKFRQEDYGGKRGVLVLFSDGSVKTVPINSKGEPVIKKKNILSSDYIAWKGETPTIYQPEGR